LLEKLLGFVMMNAVFLL